MVILKMCWERAPFSKVVPNGSLVEPFSFVEELSDVFWSVSEQLVLHQEHDALRKPAHTLKYQLVGFSYITYKTYLFGIHVKLFSSHCHMSTLLQRFAAGYKNN